MFELDNGNKCGKCQNHDFEVLKKGHARDCPFKRCNCLKCRLLDARSDILQVISGKATKLKGTKKDPNCGFCQNHGIKILRKGHVRSCGFGQEKHFKLDNCFDCEVHYIRNEVNRLQIKMRRAMKEDRTLTEEQRKTAREAITREDVEKVCSMARSARKKRESIATNQQQVQQQQQQQLEMQPQQSNQLQPALLPELKQEPQSQPQQSPQQHNLSNHSHQRRVHLQMQRYQPYQSNRLPPAGPAESTDPIPLLHAKHQHQQQHQSRQTGSSGGGGDQPMPGTSASQRHSEGQFRPRGVWRPWSQQQARELQLMQQQPPPQQQQWQQNQQQQLAAGGHHQNHHEQQQNLSQLSSRLDRLSQDQQHPILMLQQQQQQHQLHQQQQQLQDQLLQPLHLYRAESPQSSMAQLEQPLPLTSSPGDVSQAPPPGFPEQQLFNMLFGLIMSHLEPQQQQLQQ